MSCNFRSFYTLFVLVFCSRAARCESPLRTRGISFIGISDKKDWCLETRHSWLTAFRTLPNDKFAFIGDAAGVAIVQAKCSHRFNVITTFNITSCGLYGKVSDVRFHKLCFRDQIDSMPFDDKLVIDTDTITVGEGLGRVFDILDRGFEYTSAMECRAEDMKTGSTPRASDAILDGWELQTGVLGFKRCTAVQEHARRSIQLAIEHGRPYELTSAEQTFETFALADSRVRFFPLPPGFNVRSTTGPFVFKTLPAYLVHFKYDFRMPHEVVLEFAKKQLFEDYQSVGSCETTTTIYLLFFLVIICFLVIATCSNNRLKK